MRRVVLPAVALGHSKQAAAWAALLSVAPDLGQEWTLAGGQMVLLHQVERPPPNLVLHPADLRMSVDLDIVVNIRAGRRQLPHINDTLVRHGFHQQIAEIAHRYERSSDGVIVDVLAPDHLGPNLPRLGHSRTLQAAGATQALKRTATVTVVAGHLSAPIRRPSLVGALLMKVAVARHVGTGGNRMSRDLDDVWRLALLLDDEDAADAKLTREEQSRIRWATQTAARSGLGSQPANAADAMRNFLANASPSGKRSSGSTATPIEAPSIRLCLKWMPRAKESCILPKDHAGHCRSTHS